MTEQSSDVDGQDGNSGSTQQMPETSSKGSKADAEIDTDDKPSPEHQQAGKRILHDVESEREDTDRYDTSGNNEPAPKTPSE